VERTAIGTTTTAALTEIQAIKINSGNSTQHSNTVRRVLRMGRELREYSLNLFIPLLFCLAALLINSSYKLEVFGTAVLPPNLEHYTSRMSLNWLVMTMCGAFGNMLFQQWRRRRNNRPKLK